MREFKENLRALAKALHSWKKMNGPTLSTIRLALPTAAAEQKAKGLQSVSIKSKND